MQIEKRFAFPADFDFGHAPKNRAPSGIRPTSRFRAFALPEPRAFALHLTPVRAYTLTLMRHYLDTWSVKELTVVSMS